MSVKIKTVAKVLPEHYRSTADILPFLDIWLQGQDERFIRKVKKIFENAGVDKRYSIMSPEEVFSAVMQAVADRFGNHVASDADPAILAAAEEFRRWSTLPFKRGPAQAVVAQTQVTPKVLLIMLAVLVAIIAFGIIVGSLTSAK